MGLLKDDLSGAAYLVDLGTVYSILPHSSDDPPSGPHIAVADGSPIPCWGWADMQISRGGKCFSWQFLKAAVAFPLLGTDFLVNFGLLVDIERMWLVNRSGTSYPLAQPPLGGVFATASIQLLEQVLPPAAQEGTSETVLAGGMQEQELPPEALMRSRRRLRWLAPTTGF